MDGVIEYRGQTAAPLAMAARNALLATGVSANRRHSHAACGHD
ncbi:hypothetical protein [Kutzneria sp. NPDC052558]